MKPFTHLALGIGLVLISYSNIRAQSYESPTQTLTVDYSTLRPVGLGINIIVISFEQHLWHSKDGLIHFYASLGPSVDYGGASNIWGLAGGFSGTLGRRANRLELELKSHWNGVVQTTYNGGDGWFLRPPGYTATIFWPLINLAYRYQPARSGVVFRVKAGTGGVGLGVGYAF